MARKLRNTTWEEIQQEMSIAGSPEKITALGRSIMDLVTSKMDHTNHAEHTNVLLALSRVSAEIKFSQQRLEKHTSNRLKK